MTAETGLPDKVVEALKRGNKGPAKSPGEESARVKIPWMILLVVIALLAYTYLRK